MEKKKVIKELYQALSELGLEPELQISTKHIAEYLYKQLELLKWSITLKPSENCNKLVKLWMEADACLPESACKIEEKTDNSVNDFVDRMYELYPSRCPKRNASTGKSHKDKERIKRLLKIYTQDEIEQVIKDEIDNNYSINYMKNFSTFLNNFPTPTKTQVETPQKQNGELWINGVRYQ